MTNPISKVDPDGLLEYSVVFTDRSLNHMSQSFQGIMRDAADTLCDVYGAPSLAFVPGGGTYGMEAVARQFGTGKTCLVIRNGWFSYRWSQIFEAAGIPEREIVLKAAPVTDGPEAAFAPPSVEAVVAAIEAEKPDVVFAPHVETSAGIILPDDYLKAVGEAARANGALFVLDCIASGTVWVDMAASNVDVLISAPQKGWSASPCSAIVMLGERARAALNETKSTSFACDLKKWCEIMEAYRGGGHAYHATMPTDAIATFHGAMGEAKSYGFDKLQEQQLELGRRVRQVLGSRQFRSVAAPGFEAPGVVVSYTRDADIHTGKKFAGAGLQTAAGVPLMCDEPADFKTFRIGLFGLDKLMDVDGAVGRLESALDRLAA